MKRVRGMSLEWGREAGAGVMGKLGGGAGGREREERAARWRSAVVKLSGSEAAIDSRGFRRSSTTVIAAVYTLFFGI